MSNHIKFLDHVTRMLPFLLQELKELEEFFPKIYNLTPPFPPAPFLQLGTI